MSNDIYSILKGIMDDDEPEEAAVEQPEPEPVAPVQKVAKVSIAVPAAEPEPDFSLGEIMNVMGDMGMDIDVPAPNSGAPKPVAPVTEIVTEDEEDLPDPTELPVPAGIFGAADETDDDDEALSLDDVLNMEAPEEKAPDAIILPAAKAEAAPDKVIPMPTFTTDELAETMDIRNFATLVTLNTARWHGKVKDRTASADAASVAGADPLAFETQKRLLAGADTFLKKTHKAIDDARTRHYQMTLPWSVVGRDAQGRRTGGRLLPHTCFQEYIVTMGKAKTAMEAALGEFVADYQDAVARARSKLGTRFDPSEYPNPTDIQRHFGLSFDFHPVPVGDDFKGLADQQITKLANVLQRKNRAMLENAMQETWVRAYDLVSRAAAAFATPEALFHYTLLDKLRESAITLKNLNVTGDVCIERVRQAISKHLTMHDAESIRKDDDLRKQLHRVAKACLKEMDDHAKARA